MVYVWDAGFAGIAGYTWVVAFTMVLGLSMHNTLLLANFTGCAHHRFLSTLVNPLLLQQYY